MRGARKSITLVLTEDCNFACRYCYLHHKNRRNRMSPVVARTAIDYVLEHRDLFPEEEVVWEFMGGEPLLEVELIEQIIAYLRRKAFELDHPWFEGSHFSISTNGSLFGTPQVQRLLDLYGSQLEVTLTVDGPEHVHNLERVFPDGSGTYQQVAANVPLWLRRYPRASTKVTISRGNLPFVAESILHNFELGIHEIHANVVFENVWQPGDDVVFEQQLDKLGNSMIELGLWRDHSCSLFSHSLGRPLGSHENQNWCGPGRMLAIDGQGNFYPCNRFMSFSLARREARLIGNIHDGVDRNRLRPFLALTRLSQSPKQCIECEVASGCAWCQGLNYDDADTPTIFQRATHICLMHKARVRASARYWNRIDALEKAHRVEP